jgi:hypothetical protein
VREKSDNIDKMDVLLDELGFPDSEVDEEGGGHDELSSSMWHVIVNNIKVTVVGDKGAM